MPSDQHDGLVIAASRNDPERFSVIFERHVGAVFRYVARRIRGTEAEDITAQVFLEGLS